MAGTTTRSAPRTRSRPTSRGRGRGSRGVLHELGWAAFVACIAVAIWQGLPHGIRPLYDNLLHRSHHIGTVIHRETTRHGLTPATKPSPTPVPHRRHR